MSAFDERHGKTIRDVIREEYDRDPLGFTLAALPFLFIVFLVTVFVVKIATGD